MPVAAGDSAGNLAFFSQRDARSIVAPGVGLVSTVPDSIGNHDGIGNDFGSSAGTSTASAYLAGASVLLREACQRAGMGQVSEQTLYQIMTSTADTIHDSATGLDYYRLNLASAVESVLPQTHATTSDAVQTSDTIAQVVSPSVAAKSEVLRDRQSGCVAKPRRIRRGGSSRSSVRGRHRISRSISHGTERSDFQCACDVDAACGMTPRR